MNYRELRQLIRKLIKETSLLPGMESPTDLNPAYKRDDWDMTTMKPNGQIAFTLDNVEEEVFDEFLDLFGNKIEWSGDWIVASPETVDFAKKFVEREGGIFNQAPEEIVDWIIRNPNNNIVVEGFMGGSGSDGNTTSNNNDNTLNTTNNDNNNGDQILGITNDDNVGYDINTGNTGETDNIDSDEMVRKVNDLIRSLKSKGVPEDQIYTIANQLAQQEGNASQIVNDNLLALKRAGVIK